MSYNARLHLGKAAEFRAMAEMLLRGIEPALVSVDRGVDLILPSGLRLQVKSATRNHAGQVVWKFVQYRYTAGDKGKRLGQRRAPVEPHYFLLWNATDDEWFVVPSVKVQDVNAIALSKHGFGFRSTYKFEWLAEYSGRWDLLMDEE